MVIGDLRRSECSSMGESGSLSAGLDKGVECAWV